MFAAPFVFSSRVAAIFPVYWRRAIEIDLLSIGWVPHDPILIHPPADSGAVYREHSVGCSVSWNFRSVAIT
jgi:hypothetical protein